MAVAAWVLEKSAASRATDPGLRQELARLAGLLFVCPIGELEQLHSARSAAEYDAGKAGLHADFGILAAPTDTFDGALRLQKELALTRHLQQSGRTVDPDHACPRSPR